MQLLLALQACNIYTDVTHCSTSGKHQNKITFQMTDKLPEAWLKEMCWAFGMCGKKNKQKKLQWAINRNMQRFSGGRSCSPPSPLDGWVFFHVFPLSHPPPVQRRCSPGPQGFSLVVGKAFNDINERDCHTNSLFSLSHLGYMWSLSKVVLQLNVFQIGLRVPHNTCSSEVEPLHV